MVVHYFKNISEHLPWLSEVKCKRLRVLFWRPWIRTLNFPNTSFCFEASHHYLTFFMLCVKYVIYINWPLQIKFNIERSHDKNVLPPFFGDPNKNPLLFFSRRKCWHRIIVARSFKHRRHEFIKIIFEFQFQPQKYPLKKQGIKVVNSKREQMDNMQAVHIVRKGLNF